MDMLIRIKSYQASGFIVNVDKAYKLWLSQKDRRQNVQDLCVASALLYDGFYRLVINCLFTLFVKIVACSLEK